MEADPSPHPAQIDPILSGSLFPPQMVSNPSLITKQMLTFYSADTDQGRELTRLWDRIMMEVGRGVSRAGGPGGLTAEGGRAPTRPIAR